MPRFEDYVEQVRELWDSRWLTNRGPKHEELRRALAEKLDSPHAVLYANGHLALESLIDVFELSGEVITTPFTFASTTHALVRKGITPVFADILHDDYTLDPAQIEALITPKTSAIMPVHVYGTLADVDAIQAIADRHGLRVIYDAAHAFGVTRAGTSSASFGDASMFSFHATKVFHTIEGGAAFVKDERLVRPLLEDQNFGITGPESVHAVGGNAKMNEFSAIMGLLNLRDFDDEVARRAEAVTKYRERLTGVPGIYLVPEQTGIAANHAYMPVRFVADEFGTDRDTVFAALAADGIHARKYFYPLVSDFECYEGRFDRAATPVAREVATQVLTLPLYADLDADQVDRICDVILACERRAP